MCIRDSFYFIPPPELKKLSQEELDRQFAEELAAWQKVQSTIPGAGDGK